MIVRVLAATLDCRDGNCPTVWLTDRDTLVVQGFLVTAGAAGEVEVPADVLRRAAAAVRDRPERSDGGGDVVPTGRGTYLVRGDDSAPDAVWIPVPRGEAAVELAPGILRRALARDELTEAT